MELLNLRNRTLRYHSHGEIERILVSSIIKNFLEQKEKPLLFSHISEIKITEKNICIYVTKSIVKNEFQLIKEELDKEITEKLQENYDSYNRKVKIL